MQCSFVKVAIQIKFGLHICVLLLDYALKIFLEYYFFPLRRFCKFGEEREALHTANPIDMPDPVLLNGALGKKMVNAEKVHVKVVPGPLISSF